VGTGAALQRETTIDDSTRGRRLHECVVVVRRARWVAVPVEQGGDGTRVDRGEGTVLEELVRRCGDARARRRQDAEQNDNRAQAIQTGHAAEFWR
jgi:hypothetical protein